MTGKRIAKVTTGQIYWGSLPFIVIQLLMVAIVLFFPGLVTHYKGGEATISPGDVKIEVDGGFGFNPYGNPAGPEPRQ